MALRVFLAAWNHNRVAAKRAELAAICRYSRAQYRVVRDVTPEKLFAPLMLGG